jgi:hypothetical protein
MAIKLQLKLHGSPSSESSIPSTPGPLCEERGGRREREGEEREREKREREGESTQYAEVGPPERDKTDGSTPKWGPQRETRQTVRRD